MRFLATLATDLQVQVPAAVPQGFQHPAAAVQVAHAVVVATPCEQAYPLSHTFIIREMWDNPPVANGGGYDRRTRKVLHLLLGFPALLIPFIPHNIALAVAISGVLFTFWLRADRFSFINRLAKPSDRQTNTVTGFQVYAIVILILLAMIPLFDTYGIEGQRFAMYGWLAMAWGDGLSGLLGPGPRVARTVPWNPDKTWLGSLGALVGSFAAGLACFAVPLSGLAPFGIADALLLSTILAFVVATLESLRSSIDDNFIVGIGSVLTAILISGKL